MVQSGWLADLLQHLEFDLLLEVGRLGLCHGIRFFLICSRFFNFVHDSICSQLRQVSYLGGEFIFVFLIARIFSLRRLSEGFS